MQRFLLVAPAHEGSSKLKRKGHRSKRNYELSSLICSRLLLLDVTTIAMWYVRTFGVANDDSSLPGARRERHNIRV